MKVKLLVVMALGVALLPWGAYAAAKGAAPVPAEAAPAAVEPPAPLRTPCEGPSCEEQPRVVINVPPPQPAPWSLHERIAWGALLLLALVGYVGVLLALSLLRKIERATRATEEAARAAAQSAEAALRQSQALIEASRPWLVAHAEPAVNVENGFRVLLTNHGKSPARIEWAAERMMICPDEQSLPPQPSFPDEPREPSAQAIVLLPGESRQMLAFRRDELRGVCESDEQFERLESWREKLYLYGRALYRDLSDTEDRPPYETNWCCWYIHGQQKSGLVIAGPQAYNRHT